MISCGRTDEQSAEGRVFERERYRRGNRFAAAAVR
jgi:hypothetical protein